VTEPTIIVPVDAGSEDGPVLGFEEGPYDLWFRRSSGAGIGTVAGSPIKLQVGLDVGSTWYALNAKPMEVKAALESAFPDFDLAREVSLHSSAAGTTINLIITGLSAGAGLVAVEFLKEAGKDLWKALKHLLSGQAERNPDNTGKYGDTINLTLVIDRRAKIAASISLPSDDKVAFEELRLFCENAPSDLFLKELDRIERDSPLSERLKAYKDAKKERP
jgi:hypothetical protein